MGKLELQGSTICSNLQFNWSGSEIRNTDSSLILARTICRLLQPVKLGNVPFRSFYILARRLSSFVFQAGLTPGAPFHISPFFLLLLGVCPSCSRVHRAAERQRKIKIAKIKLAKSMPNTCIFVPASAARAYQPWQGLQTANPLSQY